MVNPSAPRRNGGPEHNIIQYIRSSSTAQCRHTGDLSPEKPRLDLAEGDAYIKHKTGGFPMFGIGAQELLLILLVVLVIFGANKLPEIGGGLGRAIRNFRRASTEPDEIDITPKDKKPADEDRKA